MRRLVILRPEPGAGATARLAKELGLRAIVVPLFRIEPLTWQAPDPKRFDALLLTSANAPHQAGAQLQRLTELPAHCVGERTAAAARTAELTVETVGQAGVDALLNAMPSNLELLHLCGRDRRLPTSPEQAIDSIAVYESVELPPPTELRELEGAVVAVHSPRAARRLDALTRRMEVDRGRIAIAAISCEAATAAGDGWERVDSASDPSDSALLSLAARLCDTLA